MEHQAVRSEREVWVTPDVRAILEGTQKESPEYMRALLEDIELLMSPKEVYDGTCKGRDGHTCLLLICVPLTGSPKEIILVWHVPTDGLFPNKDVKSRAAYYDLGFA